jgi:DNA-binding transcriptional LysR family regulator
MLILAAGWLTQVSLAKLIVLIIGAVILVPVIVTMLFLTIVGSSAVIAASLSDPPPWAARHTPGNSTQWRESAWRRRGRGALTWGMVMLCAGLALAYGMSAGLTESALAIVALVLLGTGAGLVVSCVVQALSGRPQAPREGETRPPDDPERARDT